MNKMKSFPAVMLVLALLAVQPVHVMDGEEQIPVAAIVTYVKGHPKVVRNGTGVSSPMKTGDFVYEGDVLKTGTKDRAAVAFKEGAEVRVNEGTEFEVTRHGGSQSERKIFLSFGQIWTRLLHHNADFAIRTTAAVAAVRGTEADVDMSNVLTVKVYEGLVDLANPAGKQSLKAGQASQVAGAASAPAAPHSMSPQEIGDWQKKFKIKNMAQLLQQLQSQTGPGEKQLKIQVEKDGQTKELQLKFKKK